MGRIAYNRDQRIANEIIDALIEFNDAVSRNSILRALVAGKSVYAHGDYLPARVWAILEALVEFGAVTRDMGEDDIPLYSLTADPDQLRNILRVSRGEFVI